MGQVLYKKIYNVKEFYAALYKALRTFKYMRRTKKTNELSSHFIERIMLAVTEVNGCEVCSYAHTRIALEQGMKDEEVKMLLTGNNESIPGYEMKAIILHSIMQIQGNPSKESWKHIIKTYGSEKALGILGAIRAIMAGNMYGIIISAFRSRIKGKKIEKTNLLYEIRMILSVIILFPVALIHSILSNIFKINLVDFW